MARVKGFAQPVADQLLDSGQLHQPNMTHIGAAEIVENDTQDVDIQAKALMMGIPVVAAEFYPQVRRASGFESYPEKTIEEHRSAHQVSFGRFIGWLPKLGKRDTILDVAIKPFENPEAALQEFHGYRKLGELMIESFQPVAIFPSRTGDHFIGLTKDRKDLISLDRDEWLRGMLVSNDEDAQVVETNIRTVKDIAQGFAYIHAQGVFHPDGQIKNWANTPEGQIGIIDTENLTTIDAGHPDAAELAWNDFEKLTKSLIFDSKSSEAKTFGVGMLAGLELIHVRSALEQMLIVPYFETLATMNAQTDDPAIKERIQMLYEGAMNHFYNDEQWPIHFVNMQHVPYSSLQPA